MKKQLLSRLTPGRQLIPLRTLLGLAMCWWLGLASGQAQSQASFAVSVTPPGPVQLAPGASQTLTATATAPAFLATALARPVSSMALQPDGKLVLVVSSTPASIIRLNPDGTLDPSFTFSAPAYVRSGGIQAIALQPDGKILVGGKFVTYIGPGYPPIEYNLLRLQPSGTLEAGFPRFVARLNEGIYKILVQPDGKVLVGGLLRNDVVPGLIIAGAGRLTADLATTEYSADAARSYSSAIYALAAQANGASLIGGIFSENSSLGSRNLVRVRAAGSSPEASFPYNNLNAAVRALAVQPADQKILIGGDFTRYTDIPRKYLARLLPSGQLDPSFATVGTGFNERVQALLVQADGKIVVGGDFTSYNGQPCNHFARLLPDGQLDPSFSQAGFNGNVTEIIQQAADQKLLVRGDFTQYGSTPQRYLARLDKDGNLNEPTRPIYGAAYTWNTGATSATLTVDTPGSYSATATVNGVAITSAPVLVTTTGAPTLYRLRAGGPALTTSRGTFSADAFYSPSSNTGATSAPIAGTNDQALYQSERYSTNGTLSYALPISNGTYQVVLHFAETYWTQPDQRVFDAYVEGKRVLTKYDIVRKVGPMTAVTETAFATVTDGILNLDLSVPYQEGGRDQAKLSALEVLPVTNPAVVRVNLGGPALMTSRGAFSANTFNPPSSNTGGTSAPIAGTPDQALYQTEQYSTNGTLTYAVPVTEGTYQVVLHFAETYWTQPDQRVFNAYLEGNKVLSKYDIVRKVGPLTATTETFLVPVTDGVLNLALTVPYEDGGRDQAKLSALEVLPYFGTGARVLAAAQPRLVRELNIYPNPANNRFTLSCSASQPQVAALQLTDQLGRVVQQQTIALQQGLNQIPVEASQLKPGLYQLTVLLADGSRMQQKVVLQP